MDNQKFFSETFIKDLLIIESLIRTDYESPKTARQIQDDVEKQWKRLFTNEPLEKNTSLKTIHKHVRDMNLLRGLYNIKAHADNKLGYYNTKHLLTPAETAVICAAVYNVSSLTDDEKKTLFNKIKPATNNASYSIACSFERQLNPKDNPQRKFSKTILPKIERICKAIVEGKKITFNLKRNGITDEESQVTASPYTILEKDNEIFLTAKIDGSPKPTDFRLTFMSKIEIQDEGFQSDKKFSIARHQAGVIKDAPQIELNISFPESFIETAVKQFNKNDMKRFRPNGEKMNDEHQFRLTVSVVEDERLYQWLRQHCDKVRIISPNNVRKKLKKQFLKALSTL